MSALDGKIDELYQGPLDDFTTARNALAKTLSGAEAASVRKLAKPTVVPWVINQLYWHARGVFDRLRKSGERLRAAQIAALKGRSADLRGATDAHRKAIAEAAAQAVRLAEAPGARHGVPGANDLMRTLEAISLAPQLPEAPGRLTRPLQPAGFEALSGVTPVAAPAKTTKSPRARGDAPGREKEDEGRQAREEKDAKRRDDAAARRAAAELAKAETALDRAAAAETRARAAWERARRERESAERAVEHARERSTR